jgi:hypothetical protein
MMRRKPCSIRLATSSSRKEDRLNNMRLIATEVMPAVREIGKELGLTSPFEVTPGSRPLKKGEKSQSVGSLAPLRAMREQSAATL